MLVALGRQNERAIPENARNIINWMPVFASPQPMVNAMRRLAPVRYMIRQPKRSAREPERRSVQPHVKAYTDAGLFANQSM
jgi:hypothetical protein